MFTVEAPVAYLLCFLPPSLIFYMQIFCCFSPFCLTVSLSSPSPVKQRISLHLLLIHKVASPKAVSDVGINTLKKYYWKIHLMSRVLHVFCFKYFSSFLCQLKGVAILLMALVQSWSKMYRLIYLHWEARIFGNIFTCVAGASLCKGVQ